MEKEEFNAVIFFRPNAEMRLTYNVWVYHNILSASIRRVAPKAQIILLLPEGAEVPFGVTADKIIFCAVADLPLMIAEVEAWRQYLHSPDFDRLTLFLDPDIIMQHRRGALWDDDYDVALTWRTDANVRHGINAGVIGCRPERKDAVIGFFDRVSSTLAALPAEDHNWYGDQEALCQITGLTDPAASPQDRLMVDDASVRILPCLDFNHSTSVDEEGNPILEYAPDPVFIHFKGARKLITFQYARQFLGYLIKDAPRYPAGKKIFPGRPLSKR